MLETALHSVHDHIIRAMSRPQLTCLCLLEMNICSEDNPKPSLARLTYLTGFLLTVFMKLQSLLLMCNCILQFAILLCQWLTAVFIPVQKVLDPNSLPDVRPISVTPILSRILEKFVGAQ